MLKINFWAIFFTCKEKRWGLPSCYKSENSKSVCILHALQNGKFADFKIYDEGKRLHMQNRFEGPLSTVPLNKPCRHCETFIGIVRFLWEGSLYEFLSLCFGLGQTPWVFTKIFKVPIFLLRRLNIRILIYLDDMSLMSQSIESCKIHVNLSPSTFGICNKL